MEQNTNPHPPERDSFFKNIREALNSSQNDPIPAPPNISTAATCHIDNPLTVFNKNFRAAGGKYLPCTTKNLVKTLVKICNSQSFGSLLNASPDLEGFLNKYNVPHTTVLPPNVIVDAALFFSDMLITRTGAIGFSQQSTLYPTVKKMARNLIIVSREKCLYQDIQDALAYQRQRDQDCINGIVEFIRPRQPELDEAGHQIYTESNPRFILLMIEEPVAPCPQQQTAQQTQAQNQPQNEPENQEPAD